MRTLKLLCLFAGINFVCYCAYSQGFSNKGDLCKIVEAEQKANSGKLTFMPSFFANDYDLKYHRLEWEIDPDINYIKGIITSYFKPKITGFGNIYFDLSLDLTVDSVKYHGSLSTFDHSNNDLLEITLPATIPVGTLDSISIYYQGVPPSSGFGSFIQTDHDGTPIIWTLSEPYGAKEWWPCKQDLVDKIDSIDVIVTTPQAYRVASNGLLVSENIVGPNKIYHWKHRYPIAAYLIAIAVTNYAYYSNYVSTGSDSLEVLNYVFPEDLASAQSQTPGIIPVIQLFDTLFEEYPFSNEKYGHAQFGWGGGMEHQTMSFMGSFGHELMAHELAHMWFGDKITCGSWQDIWLNEGFGTYLTGLTYEHMFGGIYWEIWKTNQINNITSEPDGSVWVDDTTSVWRIFSGRLSYAKGAMLLHMLRWKLGDTNFFQAIKNYLSDYSLAYGYARTYQLRQHFENTSGQNLTEFINDWFYGEGYPSYQITWSQTGNVVNLTVSQTQSHSSVSFFEMPVPIQFKGQSQETILVFDHTYSGQSFLSLVDFTVDSVFFDPYLWIISANNSVTLVNPAGCTLSATVLSTNESFAGAGDGSATVIPSEGTPPYTYFWDDPNAQTDSTATGLSTGNYQVYVSDSGCCGYIVQITVGLGTGNAEQISGETLRLFPNPAKNNFIIELSDKNNSIKSVQIINILGEQIKNIFFNFATHITPEIGIQEFPKGIYFVKIIMSDGVAVKKIIK
ncbi:MAG: M1 family aminopeptidase [Bacteroidota bacterium]